MPKAPTPAPAPIVHFEIGSKDLAKTRKFYGDLLGWQSQEGGPNMAMLSNLGSYANPATEGIGGHFSSLGHEPHQYVTVYAQVQDIDATLKQAGKLGGKTIVPKQEVPDMGWFAWFADPEGNVIGLWTPMAHHEDDARAKSAQKAGKKAGKKTAQKAAKSVSKKTAKKETKKDTKKAAKKVAKKK